MAKLVVVAAGMTVLALELSGDGSGDLIANSDDEEMFDDKNPLIGIVLAL